jgi:hypothetical protein
MTVDQLAQIIRTVDGENRLGAGALAEAILAAILAASTPSPAPAESGAVAEPVGYLNAHGGFLLTDSGASWLKDAIAADELTALGQPVVAVFANPEPAMSTELVERLRAGPIRTGDTEYGEYELFDIEEAAQTMHEVADELTALTAKVALLTEALEWYGERARLARLIHSGGDPARFELSDDGGKRRPPRSL